MKTQKAEHSKTPHYGTHGTEVRRDGSIFVTECYDCATANRLVAAIGEPLDELDGMARALAFLDAEVSTGRADDFLRGEAERLRAAVDAEKRYQLRKVGAQ